MLRIRPMDSRDCAPCPELPGPSDPASFDGKKSEPTLIPLDYRGELKSGTTQPVLLRVVIVTTMLAAIAYFVTPLRLWFSLPSFRLLGFWRTAGALAALAAWTAVPILAVVGGILFLLQRRGGRSMFLLGATL